MTTNWRAVPMPPQIAALPRDPRGYPVFYAVRPPDYHAGDVVDFRTLEVEAHLDAGERRLCAICGLALPYWLWFLGGPMCLANRIFGDGPMHRECMEYAIAVCPFLSHASMQYAAVKDPKFFERVDDRVAGDPNLILMRPTRMLLVRVRGYTIVENTGGKPVFRIDPPSQVEWRAADGTPLPPEELVKTYVLCPALDGPGQILCLRCLRVSANPNDVAELYCGKCRRFHDEALVGGVRRALGVS